MFQILFPNKNSKNPIARVPTMAARNLKGAKPTTIISPAENARRMAEKRAEALNRGPFLLRSPFTSVAERAAENARRIAQKRAEVEKRRPFLFGNAAAAAAATALVNKNPKMSMRPINEGLTIDDMKMPTSTKPVLITKPVTQESISIESSRLASQRSLDTFFATGEINTLLRDGLSEMGPNYSDWNSVQAKLNLTPQQLEMLKGAYNKFYGMTTDDLVPISDTTDAKKPNVLLLVGAAVVGLIVIRKILN